MDEAAIRALIADALRSSRGDNGLDETAFAASVAGSLSDTLGDAVQSAVADAEKARADAEQERADAEKAFEARVEAEIAERMGKKKEGNPFKKKAEDDDEDEETMAKKEAEAAEARAEARADLLVLVRGLLPGDFSDARQE